MITDEQGREWLLQKFYDNGYRYYVKDISGCVFLTKKEPTMIDDILDVISCGFTKSVDTVKEIMPNIDGCGILDIAEELGIVDWSKVAVDTPVLVRDFEEMKWGKRYFAFFKDGKVHTWNGGVTSWTSENPNNTLSWAYAKLAEV